MKKLFTLLTLCILCICCAFSFTACDFSVSNNSGKEIINEQPEEKNENGENNNEENISITADTDFDALKSDKVEKDVFINACKFLFINWNPYVAADVNCTLDVPNNNYYMTVKIDGIKRFYELKPFVAQNNFAYYQFCYALLAEDIKSCAYYQGGYGGVHKGRYGEDELNIDKEKLNKLIEALWESVEYNTETKQFEIASFINNYFGEDNVWNNVRIKIKNGYAVYFECTHIDGYKEWAKCYDIGTTTVEIPDDIMQALNNAR